MTSSVRPEEWEILRRSVVMVSPGCPAPLCREQAIELLEELIRLAAVERRVVALVGELTGVLEQHRPR